jgi:DNA replication protein DnaC
MIGVLKGPEITMLNYLLKKIKLINVLIKELDNKFCGKCNKGFIEIKRNVFNIDFSVRKICSCQEIVFDNEKINRLELLEKKSFLIDKFNKIKLYIPSAFQEKVFFENQDQRVKSFINNSKIFLWIYGKNGVGKTSILNAIKINQIMNNKIHFLEIINECNFSYLTDIKNFLAIDDVYKLKDNQRLRYLLPLYYNLINTKWENQEKLIFTSNFSLYDFINEIAAFDDDTARAIQDRMHNLTEVIHLQGESFRKKNNNIFETKIMSNRN